MVNNNVESMMGPPQTSHVNYSYANTYDNPIYTGIQVDKECDDVFFMVAMMGTWG